MEDEDLLGLPAPANESVEAPKEQVFDRHQGWKRGLYPPKPARTRVYNHEIHCGKETTIDGLPCTNGKGHGTQHVGKGACKYHGGSASDGYKIRGLYTGVESPSLANALERVRLSGTDPLDLAPEVEALRAIVIDFIERRDEYVESLIAFKQSFNAGITTALGSSNELSALKAVQEIKEAINMRPIETIDISAASTIIDRVGRMAERIHKMRTTNTITMDQIKKLLDNMGMSLARHVQDADVIRRIQEEWSSIEI